LLLQRKVDPKFLVLLCVAERVSRTSVFLVCRPVSTRGELKDVIVEMSKQAQVGQLSVAQATQVMSEV